MGLGIDLKRRIGGHAARPKILHEEGVRSSLVEPPQPQIHSDGSCQMPDKSKENSEDNTHDWDDSRLDIRFCEKEESFDVIG